MREQGPGPILVAFDGSGPARAAVLAAARLFGPRDAIVLTAWQSVARAAAISVLGMPAGVAAESVARLDEAAGSEAGRLAAEGAELATSEGLRARADTATAERNEWSAIVAAAERHEAAAVVVGSRGRTRLGSAVLGSVSSGVVHHCGRPVLVVHGPEEAEDELGGAIAETP